MTDVLETTEVTPESQAALIETLKTEKANLERRLANVTQYRDQLDSMLTQSRTDRQNDVNLIGNVFLEVLSDEGYEPYYDDAVGRLNYRLTYELPERERNYTVDVQLRLNFGGVRATDAETAEEAVADTVRAIERAIDNYNIAGMELSATASVGEYDAEEEDE